jgi:FKBP-type peptidyl-prolyl cis-trans isomerase (trigger factor)
MMIYKNYTDYLKNKIKPYLPLNENINSKILETFFQKMIPNCLITIKGKNLTIENINAFEFPESIIYLNYQIKLLSDDDNVANFELEEISNAEKLQIEENILKQNLYDLFDKYPSYNWDGKNLVFFDNSNDVIEEFSRADLNQKIKNFPIL